MIRHKNKKEFLQLIYVNIAKDTLGYKVSEHCMDLMKVLEYISEAEHGDGGGYWDNFKDGREVFDDFIVYWDGHSTQTP